MKLHAALFLFLTSCSIFRLAVAESETPEMTTRSVYYHSSYRVNDDGSYQQKVDWATQVLAEKAIEGAKERSISYSTSIEKTEVLEAYTLKPDGRKVQVLPSSYQIETQTGRDSANPAFSDRTTLTVIFPDVSVGDTVVFSYRTIATEPIYPGHFSETEVFHKTSAYDDVTISMDLPISLKVDYQLRELTETTNEIKDGRHLWVWSWKNPNPITNKRRDYSVYEWEEAPGFAISTFKTNAELAEIYGFRARPKAIVTPRIQLLADEISHGKNDRREIAKSLYEWVALNITYAGNCIGLGAVVPRDLDFVLDNKMGDCKDHATLLQALLTAKNISSTQALINAGSSYQLPKIPLVSMVNHVINYLPEWDLYVDSTSDSTPFGMLPFGDQDKPVLWVDGFKEGTKTPPSNGANNTQVMKTRIKINADGSATGDVSVVLKGSEAVESRASYRNLAPEMEKDLVKWVLKRSGLSGAGTFRKDDPKPLLDHFSYSAQFKIETLLELPEPGAIVVRPILMSPSPISEFTGYALMDEEEMAPKVACWGANSLEEYEIEFPANIKILTMPRNLEIKNPTYRYAASYQKRKNTILIKREINDVTKGNVCTFEALKAYKTFAKEVSRNLRAQIVYQ